MLKFLKVLVGGLIASAIIAVPIVAAADVGSTESNNANEGMETSPYVVTVGSKEMTVNRETLHLTIKDNKDQDNAKYWYSGMGPYDYCNEEHTHDASCIAQGSELNKKMTDALIITYINKASKNTGIITTSTKPMSGLKPIIELEEKENGFHAKINLSSIKLKLELQVTLEGNKLKVQIPSSSIKENQEKLQQIVVYPYFDSCSSREISDDNISYKGINGGKILVPDGSGAIIDLSKKNVAKEAYTARVYGGDFGVKAPIISSTAPKTASMPVFAMMYNDHGTMVTADNGAEYCNIKVETEQMPTHYNFGCFEWLYREEYAKIYSQHAASQSTYTEERYQYDLQQTMTLFDDETNEVNVANEYRNSFNFEKKNTSDKAGLRLQFLMSENKAGMFGDTTIAMTTTDYIDYVASKVSEYCKNLSISAYGYTDGGLNGSYPDHFGVESKTGSKKDYINLAKKLTEQKINFSYMTDTLRAYKKSSVREKELAFNISTQFIEIDDYLPNSTEKLKLLNLNSALKRLKEDVATIKEYGGDIDYQSLGYMLYSGYDTNAFTRTKMMEELNKFLSETDTTANIIKPNSYLWKNCSAYLETPISSSEYMIESYSVPFLQMVLGGYVDMYSDAINLNYTGEELVARLIDFNVYPSFTITEKDALELYGTNSAGLFTSSFTAWEEKIQAIYKQVDSALSKVKGCTVTERTNDGSKWKTTYSNNVTIEVDYKNLTVTLTVNGQEIVQTL